MSIISFPEVAHEIETRLEASEQEFDQCEKHIELLIHENERLRTDVAKGKMIAAYLIQVCKGALNWLDQAMPTELPGLKAYLAHCIDHAEQNAVP